MRLTTHALGAAAVGTAIAVSGLAAPTQAADISYKAKGQVVRVTDGDTFLGRVPAEGSGKSRIRLSGVQAMERGECHAKDAERRLRRLLPRHSAVTVKARFKGSKVPNKKERDQPRPLRLAFNSKGVDVQYELLRAGLVLPNLMRRETVNEKEYWEAAQVAAQSGVGLWNTAGCGSGPSQEAQLRVMVNYNADGNDRQNPNGKYARVVNAGVTPVDLGAGWFLRTAKHAKFEFPRGTQLAPGGEVLVHQGSGNDGGGHFYWGSSGNEQKGEKFTNPDASRYKMGGAYLVDRDGDVRAWSLYPCKVNCSDPLDGKVSMQVVYDPEGNENEYPNQEVVKLRNTSPLPIDFSYRVIEVGDAEVLEFPAGTVANPGEAVEVHVGRGSASRLHHYLGRDSSILPNAGKGARVILRNHEARQLACYAWGRSSC